MTYRECYEQGCRTLQAAGIEEAALDARLLLEAVCGTDRNDLLVHEDDGGTEVLVFYHSVRATIEQATGVVLPERPL